MCVVGMELIRAFRLALRSPDGDSLEITALKCVQVYYIVPIPSKNPFPALLAGESRSPPCIEQGEDGQGRTKAVKLLVPALTCLRVTEWDRRQLTLP